MPLRPGYGTKGKPVTLLANYFELIANGSQRIFRYNIEIKQAKDDQSKLSGRRARRIIELLLEEHLGQQLDHLATDYRSNLVSRGQLEIQKGGYPVTFRAEGEDDPADKAKTYECILVETGTLSISELTDYLSSTRASELYGSKAELIQSINIVVGQYCKTHLQIASIGPNKHYDINGMSMESTSLGAGLLAVRGFFISARAATARILLNVQVKNAAFYQHGPLIQLMHMYAAGAGRNVAKLDKFLSRVRVSVTHLPVRKNKRGEQIQSVKTILGVARPGDGRRMEHPPRVNGFGAGADGVQFWFVDDKQFSKGGNGKKGKQPARQGPLAPGRYITVTEYFKLSASMRTRSIELS